MYTIYALRNIKTGQVYIGKTVEFSKRIDRHFNDLRTGKHHNCSLQTAWDSGYSLESIILEEVSTLTEAVVLEETYIQEFILAGLAYNIGLNSIAGDNLSNHPHRLEIIKKISIAVKKKVNNMTSEERREVFGNSGESNGMYGKTHTVGARKAISRANTGNSYAKGAVRTEEQKALLSELASKRTGEENPFFGKHHSEETRKKLSEIMKGKLPPNARKVSAFGIVYSSAAECGRAYGITTATVINRIKNPKNVQFNYADN
jgi:group I intron endonuclease